VKSGCITCRYRLNIRTLIKTLANVRGLESGASNAMKRHQSADDAFRQVANVMATQPCHSQDETCKKRVFQLHARRAPMAAPSLKGLYLVS